MQRVGAGVVPLSPPPHVPAGVGDWGGGGDVKVRPPPRCARSSGSAPRLEHRSPAAGPGAGWCPQPPAALGCPPPNPPGRRTPPGPARHDPKAESSLPKAPRPPRAPSCPRTPLSPGSPATGLPSPPAPLGLPPASPRPSPDCPRPWLAAQTGPGTPNTPQQLP